MKFDYNKLTIDSDVPLPSPKKRERKKTAADFAELLNVGDSVLVETLSQAQFMRKVLKQLNRGVTTRREGEGYRVWRVRKNAK